MSNTAKFMLTPETQETLASLRRLTVQLAGGCRMLSVGSDCTCPRCDVDRLDAELSRLSAALEAMTAERDKARDGLATARAWKDGAIHAGHGQPMPGIEERHKDRSSREIAAFEMGYAFIHNSDVAREMARRIHTVAERAAKDEVEVARARDQLGSMDAELCRLQAEVARLTEALREAVDEWRSLLDYVGEQGEIGAAIAEEDQADWARIAALTDRTETP